MVQTANDCFRLGKEINQFRHLCSTKESLNSISEESEASYSTIRTSSSEQEEIDVEEPPSFMPEDVEDDQLFEISLTPDSQRLCGAKQAYDKVLNTPNASLMSRFPTANESFRLQTKVLIRKMDDLGKQVDLDIATILSEQIKDPVHSIVRSWLQSVQNLIRSPQKYVNRKHSPAIATNLNNY